MTYIDDKLKDHLTKILSAMKNKVNIVFFTQEFECTMCHQTRLFLLDFAHITDKINLTIYDYVKDAEKAEHYKIDKIPAIVILDKDDKDTGIRFYGMPGGYEINSFIVALLEVSDKKEDLPDSLIKRIKAIDKELHIQVFVTLSCPYCPTAVINAHRFALENNRITADMVESSVFPHLAVKYQVQSVPKIIINEKTEMIGAQPIDKFLEVLENL